MNKFLTLSTSTAVLSSLFIITGCSSSDDGPAAATVPANAVVINETNAEATVASSVTSFDTLDTALGAEVAPAMGLKAALALVEPKIDAAKSALNNSGSDPVYGVAVSDSGNCNVSGTFSFSGDESGTFPSFSDSGTITMTNCDDGFGFILNGSLSFTSSWNVETGSYSDTGKGSMTIEGTGAQTFKFSFTGLDYAETGNDLVFGSETYTITRATYAIDFTANGISSGGFAVKLTAPVVESSGGYDSCPESGTILITGANGTTAEGTYNGDGTMTVKANGVVVNASANCYY